MSIPKQLSGISTLALPEPESVDLSFGKDKKWRILSKAQLQIKAFIMANTKVILPGKVRYKINVPHTSFEVESLSFGVDGPVTLKTLLNNIDEIYLEHGGSVRNMGSIADGLYAEKLEKIGEHSYVLVLS